MGTTIFFKIYRPFFEILIKFEDIEVVHRFEHDCGSLASTTPYSHHRHCRTLHPNCRICCFTPPPTLQNRPPWGHVLVGRYKNKEVIGEDAHDVNQKKEQENEFIAIQGNTLKFGILIVYIMEFIMKIWRITSPTGKMLMRNWFIHFPLCFVSYNLVFGHQQHIPRQTQTYWMQEMLLSGNFVFVHPPNTNIYLVWMDRTLTTVQLARNRSQYGQFQMQ